jgi:hypothetical protein
MRRADGSFVSNPPPRWGQGGRLPKVSDGGAEESGSQAQGA